MHSVSIETVMVGRIRPFGPNDEPSAIRKEPVGGPIYLGLTGVDGDEQAYHTHGGPDKALLHYAAENYRIWHRFYAGFSLGRGGFGENISTVGITEETVCIGDRYRIGENVVIKVSQPRQPRWILGCNLSFVGPGISAAYSCMPPIPSNGKTATDSTIIPIPPIQCVMLLQNKIPFGTASISIRIVAPVVVNPDMVSKNASVKSGITPLKIKGRVPKREITIQVVATMKNPSLIPIYLSRFFMVSKKRMKPVELVINPDISKA